MNALVLGHLVLDEIHSYDGRVYRTPGGITFPLRTFAALAGDGDRVRPVFPYGPDADDVVAAFAEEPVLDCGGCWRVPDPTTRVRLFHESPSQYNTQLVASLGPIPRTRFAEALAETDLVYCNMMTGEDILLEDAMALRGAGRLVYLDLHMIAYRVHADGRREPAPSERWRDWVAAADVVQCNEHEFDALTGGGDDPQLRIRRMFDAADLRAVVLTRGERGAVISLRDGAHFHVPAIPPQRVVDPTGCGDAFGSTLAWQLARGADPAAAAAQAAQAASFVASLAGSDGMHALRAHMREGSA